MWPNVIGSPLDLLTAVWLSRSNSTSFHLIHRDAVFLNVLDVPVRVILQVPHHMRIVHRPGPTVDIFYNTTGIGLKDANTRSPLA